MSKYYNTIEWCCMYLDAVRLYKEGGLYKYDPFFDGVWECYDEDVFFNEEDARKAWKDSSESFVWDPAEFGADENEPEVGITFRTLSRYDENDEEEVLEWSRTNVTPEDIQEMYPDFDFENAEW